ncbi:MAG: glycosyltransferase family 4 protein [Dolichospermum sp. LBC05a]|jgi:glycosyltransferase involved in cell wall biosynthesis|nr:glycosyltransferase family 4 protein [Dolichospermum sp. OL01]MCO5796405.1 glycosyltransferase family 4 protein [Dolichospermum sp. OL03]MCS6281613.1 glycosyltransferase family 4 protein [Dolichospermum sp.]QSV58014.1 MAG: glycosyltransferase family 4 protein [Dolichospermum sp. LBC05a]
MKLLYYSPASYGGIADYAHEQANALVDLGVEVTLLCSPQYPTGRGEKYKIVPILKDIQPEQNIKNKLFKKIHFAKVILVNFTKLANYIEEHKFQYVLLGSYTEYLAPLWSTRLQKLAKNGVIFGAIVHDPVRNFVVGPLWWHRWSIACGYSFIREAFVHETIELDTVKSMPQLRTTVIPFGIYHFPKADKSREQMLTKLSIPLNAKVMLAFGHIRDNKNLDLVIRAISNFLNIYLIIAGKEQSSGQKSAALYQNLAKDIGVADRCCWQIGFIPDQEVANLFEAADVAILTYSKTFRSASSALNTAANYGKPCLASAGESSLKSVVQKYNLGVWVEPDNLDTLVQGIKQWLDNPPNPQWEKYIQDNSWEKNTKLVITSFKG